jgi:hypothetical protein
MSGTHAARSLTELSTSRLARVEQDVLVILDRSGLEEFCGYVPVPDESGRRALL